MRHHASGGLAALASLAVLASIVACMRSAPQAVPAPARPPDLAVVTWNLHGGAGQLNALVTGVREGRLTGGAPPLNYVLLLQEATAASRIDGLETFFAPARRIDGVEQGNAILSSLPLANQRVIELPRERQPRLALVANIHVSDTDLVLVNVHLENRASWLKGGLPGDNARARQMEALLNQLPDRPGVLGGDLNIWLGRRERAYQLALDRFSDFPPDHEESTFRGRLALDHLLFRLPGKWLASRARATSRYGSDHFPVVGTLVNR